MTLMGKRLGTESWKCEDCGGAVDCCQDGSDGTCTFHGRKWPYTLARLNGISGMHFQCCQCLSMPRCTGCNIRSTYTTQCPTEASEGASVSATAVLLDQLAPSHQPDNDDDGSSLLQAYHEFKEARRKESRKCLKKKSAALTTSN